LIASYAGASPTYNAHTFYTHDIKLIRKRRPFSSDCYVRSEKPIHNDKEP